LSAGAGPSEPGDNVAVPLGSSDERLLGTEEGKFLRLVAEDDPVADEHFCYKAVERLALAGKLEEALNLADAALPTGICILFLCCRFLSFFHYPRKVPLISCSG